MTEPRRIKTNVVVRTHGEPIHEPKLEPDVRVEPEPKPKRKVPRKRKTETDDGEN